jgi:hypothetical protein
MRIEKVLQKFGKEEEAFICFDIWIIAALF